MRRITTLALPIVVLALAGCAAPGTQTQGTTLANVDPPPATTQPARALPTLAVPDLGVRRHVAGHSVEGRPIEYVVLGDDAAAETVLLLATIHGDESAGTPLLNALIGRLEAAPELLAGRRVVVVPVANPDGMAGRRRHNSRGVDLNRNFPADNRREGVARYGGSALSEPESRALFELIERFKPARVVSFHQDIACVDYDGPGAKLLAERFVAAAPDLALRKLGAQPGSLGAYVGETLGIPVITVELPPDATIAARDIWESYGPAVLAMIDDGAGAAARSQATMGSGLACSRISWATRREP